MGGRRTQRARGDDGARTRRRVVRIALVTAALACGFEAHRVALAAPSNQAATVVSLNLRGVPASKAYAELAREAGMAFAFKPEPVWGQRDEPLVTARLIQEPFWAAIDQLNRQSGLVVHHIARQPAPVVTLYRPQKPGNFGELQTYATGAFYSTLLDHTVFSRPPRSQQPRRGHRRLAVRLDAEPKLRPLFWHSMQVEELIDGNGRHIPHLVLLNHSAPRMVPFYGGPASISLRVEGPTDGPLRISRFNVTGKVMASRRPDVAEVTGLNSSSPRPGYAGGFRVEAENVTTAQGRLLRVSLTRASGDDGPDWLRPATRMYVLDPVVLDNKNRRVNASPVDFRVAGRSCHMLLKVTPPNSPAGTAKDRAGEPHRLLLDIPSDVTDYDVRLHFTDVTMK